MTVSHMPERTRPGSPKAWDVIVIGSGLGGLSAAAYAAAAGCRTLLLERYDVLGGCSHVFRRKRKWEFDVGVHYIGDCGPGGQVPRLLHGLGLEDRITFLPLDRDGFDRIIAPGFELRVPVGLDAYLENLIAAFPADARALRRYMRVMAGIGRRFDRSTSVANWGGMMRLAWDSGRYAPWMMAPHSALLAACGLSPEAIMVLSVHAGTYGATPDITPVAFHAGFLENFVTRGGWYPQGGGQVFGAGLSDVLRTHGGEVRTGAAVEKILVEGRRATGVRLADGEVLRAPVVISNADLKRTYSELVGYEHLPRRSAWRNERWRMAWPVINSYFGIEKDLSDTPNCNYYVIPTWEGTDTRRDALRMFSGVLPKAGRSDPQEWAHEFARRQFGFVMSSTRRDPSNGRSAPAGSSAVECMTMGPGWPELWGLTASDIASGAYRRNPAYREIKEMITDAFLDRVEQAIPGARESVRWSEFATPATQVRYTGSTEGSTYGLAPTTTQIGAMRPGPRTPIRGLLVVGTSTKWGTGTEGAMISGLHAASVASGRDLETEIRSGAVIADRSRLTTRGADFDPLAACRRLHEGSTAQDHDDDRDATPVLIAGGRGSGRSRT